MVRAIVMIVGLSMVALVLVPAFNDVFSDTLLPLIEGTGAGDLEIAVWTIMPILMLIAIPYWIIRTLIQQRRGKGEQ